MNNTLSTFIKNKKNIKYGVAVFSLYIYFLLTTIPASVALSLVNLPNIIKLSSVSGTIWSGSAQQLQYSKAGYNFDLGSLSWELNPLYLLIGELSVDISITNNEQYINSEIYFSPSGKVELAETRFKIDLSSLQPLTYGMPVSYSGDVSGYFPVSFIHKNNILAFEGRLSLTNFNLASPLMSSGNQDFGDFSLEFQIEEDGATSGKIKDTGGPLSIEGLMTLNKKSRFHLTTKLSAREAGSDLDKMLSFLGTKDGGGRVTYNFDSIIWR